MARKSQQTFLKRQREQQRDEKAARKRSRREAARSGEPVVSPIDTDRPVDLPEGTVDAGRDDSNPLR